MPAINQGRLRAPQRARPVETDIEADTGNPAGYEPRILLPCGEASVGEAPAREQQVSGLFPRLLDVCVNGLSRLLRQLETDRMSGFPLADGRTQGSLYAGQCPPPSG